MENGTNSTNSSHKFRSMAVGLSGGVSIPLYGLIFILAVVGNSLVILTLVQNKRMRTVTNVFLLNLAVSDLLLAVLCMPFTLIPMLMRNFIFGSVVCVGIRYLQAVCVGVGCFTLVAISLERYFAICQPLRSRRWQTLSHSYKTIAVCWLLAGAIMIPIGVFQTLRPLPRGRAKCIEMWTDVTGERFYTAFLNVVLLILPIAIMACSYGTIIRTLHIGITMERNVNDEYQGSSNDVGDCNNREQIPLKNFSVRRLRLNPKQKQTNTHEIRKSNVAANTASKKRVILVLFVIVIEFFICWTPLYLINTWIVFHSDSATYHISPMVQSFVYLLCYISSCCNPITYCFLHKNFRQGFMSVCRCPWLAKDIGRQNRDSVNVQTEITRDMSVTSQRISRTY